MKTATDRISARIAWLPTVSQPRDLVTSLRYPGTCASLTKNDGQRSDDLDSPWDVVVSGGNPRMDESEIGMKVIAKNWCIGTLYTAVPLSLLYFSSDHDPYHVLPLSWLLRLYFLRFVIYAAPNTNTIVKATVYHLTWLVPIKWRRSVFLEFLEKLMQSHVSSHASTTYSMLHASKKLPWKRVFVTQVDLTSFFLNRILDENAVCAVHLELLVAAPFPRSTLSIFDVHELAILIEN